MPLFKCDKCNAIDNTALADYWHQKMLNVAGGQKFEPLCTECATGAWHNEFPKQTAAEMGYVQIANDFYGPAGGWERSQVTRKPE